MSWEQFTLVFGGVGLFLLGMTFLTEGLKAMAGASLRQMLARFTRGRISALASGVAFTAGVQSSSVTTLVTIGFVNAGLLTFQQALGVLYGANLGTTLTAWMVSLLGIKIQAAAFALPLIGVGALLKLFGKDRTAQAGLAAAGFGVLFLGIDMMQAGLAGTGEWTFLHRFSAENYGGRFILMGIGVLMTVVMQSSSAALAVTLTATAAGSIQLADAAALAIGQNIGTTFKAVLASLGGTADAKRAAAAHVIFNAVTGLVAIAMLGPFLGLVEGVGEGEPAVVLAAFHTAFNLLGIALMLPFIEMKTRMLQQTFRSDEEALGKPKYLDKSVLSMPGTAVEAVERELEHLSELAAKGIVLSMRRSLDDAMPKAARWEEERLFQAANKLTATMTDYLERIDRRPETARVFGLLRVMEHLRGAAQQAHDAAERRERLGKSGAAVAQKLQAAERMVQQSAQIMAAENLDAAERAVRLAAQADSAQDMRSRLRRELFRTVADGRIAAGAAMELAEYVAQLERTVYHLARAAHYWSAPEDHLPDDNPADAGDELTREPLA